MKYLLDIPGINPLTKHVRKRQRAFFGCYLVIILYLSIVNIGQAQINWTIETIGPAFGQCSHCSNSPCFLELDSRDNPHVIYSSFDMYLRYAYHDGTSWTRYTVGTLGDSIFTDTREISFALDRPHSKSLLGTPLEARLAEAALKFTS